jgi:rod shape-determining protein MreD
MHWTRLVLVILLATILQLALNNFLPIAFRPDLLIIVMVFFVANTEGNWPIIAAFAVGFAADLISPVSMMGPHTIAFGVTGSLLALARRSITLDNAVFVGIAVFIVCYIAGVLSQFLISFHQQTPPGAYLSLLWASLASAVIGPYIYSMLRAASDFFGTRQHRTGHRGK